MTTNPLYGYDDLGDLGGSIYDDIEESHYDDLNENQVYLDVLSDEADEGCGVQLPSPRPVTKSQDQIRDQGYEGLKEKKPDHEYRHVLNDESEGRDQDTKAEDQDQGTKLQEQG